MQTNLSLSSSLQTPAKKLAAKRKQAIYFKCCPSDKLLKPFPHKLQAKEKQSSLLTIYFRLSVKTFNVQTYTSVLQTALKSTQEHFNIEKRKCLNSVGDCSTAGYEHIKFMTTIVPDYPL